MNILSIETSCDETGICILKTEGDFPNAEYEILGNALFSQIDIHTEYGGVFPAVAKREHAKTLVPMLEKALGGATLTLPENISYNLTPEKIEQIIEILYREPGLAETFLSYLEKNKNGETYGRPAIDVIAVTSGPGLEPALWVGINFAKALTIAWDIPLMPINHMEGHIFVSLFDGKKLAPIEFPGLALLISGGHTELVLMKRWNEYELVGQTRDDAVGEAFDKVARMLRLPYPGGPQISKLAEAARTEGVVPSMTLPRPMITADNCDFSFSGLKTAVLYTLKKPGEEKTEDQTISLEIQKELALEFENAAAEVLVAKTKRTIDKHDIQTLILGGGVSANTHIRRVFSELFASEYPQRLLYLPDPKLTTDNAVMIALAAHARFSFDKIPSPATIVADGNLSLHGK